MQIELTPSEIRTLKFYLSQALIDAKGSRAIGIGSGKSVNDLESVIAKIGGSDG